MDVMWFKSQQKKAGVTAEEIAKKMGRTRSNISHIYSGQQKMSLEWAQAFADVLDRPLDEVLKRAGALEPEQAQTVAPGFADSDVAPWVGKPGAERALRATAETLGGGKPGIDPWTVKSNALQFAGLLPNDIVLIDTNQSERCQSGDIVIAQIFNWQKGTAQTVLRRYEPPVLVAASAMPEFQRVHFVDGNNVVIKGKVIASWRR